MDETSLDRLRRTNSPGTGFGRKSAPRRYRRGAGNTEAVAGRRGTDANGNPMKAASLSVLQTMRSAATLLART
jgi:hypothetical protein